VRLRVDGPWCAGPFIDESRTVRLEITQRADLAVRALALLDCSSDRVKSAALAEELGTTPGFIPQVMGPLVRAGWIRSVPGPTGGYEPLVALGALSVLEVIEQIDGPTDTGRCVVAERACDASEPCALHVAWARARGELRTSLAGLTLDNVAGGC
jgi:Rrf2 family iron-sulfur cluster assembly transcriptional regulator